MKIYLDNVNLNSNSGPNNFAKRLVKGLAERSHDVTWIKDSPDDYDVSLSFIERTPNAKRSRPNVLRIDGIWFKEEEIRKGMNQPLMSSYLEADGVIVQSEFDSLMINKFFGQRKHNIIRNGIDSMIPDTFNVVDAVVKIRQDYKRVFVCSSNWHGQKRLIENISLFKSLEQHLGSSCLIVMGTPDVMPPFPHIFYTGNIDPKLCKQVFAISDWMIHAAWLDHCPNVVLESLSAQTPVICTNSGGTHEILRGKRDVKDIGLGRNGIVLPDIEYNFEPMDYDNPPMLMDDSYDILFESLMGKQITIDTSTFDIGMCIDSYVKVLESVV